MSRMPLPVFPPTDAERRERDIALLDKLIPMARSVLRDAQAKLDRMQRKRDELIAQREQQ